MKRKVISAISLSITAYAAGAHAQSSVTLYGIVDTGIAYIHNSGGQSSQWKMSAGNLSGNEWGLKGTEDLGGGLSASFQLENSFDLGSGQLQNDGRMFGRQAFVGLGSTRFGTVTLGRQYDPVTDLVQPITADSYSGLFAPPGDIDNYDDSARFNSAVKWTSPSWGGVTVETMYAFGGVAGSTGSGQSWSAAAAYSEEYFALYRRYLQARHPDGGMDDARPEDFARFLYTAWSPTRFVEFRSGGRLLAVAVTDFCADGLSAVYTFFEPDEHARGLGTFAILSQIRLAAERALPYVYLGFWIARHPKMNYKARFRPLEVLHGNAWTELKATDG